MANKLPTFLLVPLVNYVKHFNFHLSTNAHISFQARLRRHQLPRVRYDGLIEYSMPPSHFLDASMNNSVGGGLAAAESLAIPNIAGAAALDDENLDFEWIMRANVGPGSAFTR